MIMTRSQLLIQIPVLIPLLLQMLHYDIASPAMDCSDNANPLITAMHN